MGSVNWTPARALQSYAALILGLLIYGRPKPTVYSYFLKAAYAARECYAQLWTKYFINLCMKIIADSTFMIFFWQGIHPGSQETTILGQNSIWAWVCLFRIQNGLNRFLGMFSFLIERLFVCIWIITQIHFDDEHGDEQYWISSQT